MLLHARGDGQNIRIENNVLRINACFLSQNFISALTNSHFVFKRGGLTFFIKGHNDHGRTIAFTEFCLADESLFAFF